MLSHMQWVRIGVALVAAPFLLLAPWAVAGETVEVRIADYKYAPADLQIRAGTTVRWINAEKRTSHSVLFTGPGGFESDRIFPGESWQRVFDKPGTHEYTCGPHPEMKGRIEVTE